MFDSSALLLGTLFHICTNVCIQEDRLSYDDLLLDIWVSPDSRVRVLDEDELQEGLAAGRINQAELSCIRGSQQYITLHYNEIISELVPFDLKSRRSARPAQT
jgi:protein associated with RNAse G/E